MCIHFPADLLAAGRCHHLVFLLPGEMAGESDLSHLHLQHFYNNLEVLEVFRSKFRKNRKIYLTHTDQYNIISQCDEVRKCLNPSPGNRHFPYEGN